MTAWETEINDVLKEFGITNRDDQPDAAERLQSALQDYTDLAKEHSKMLKHYQCAEKAIERGGALCCPVCGKRIHYNHTYCHWCGKKIGWGK